MAEVRSFGSKGLDELDLDDDVKEQLRNIQDTVEEAYRDGFFELTQAVKQQASAINRIQQTLNLVLEHVVPEIASKAKIPVAVALAGSSDDADVAKALVVADPIGAGYSMSQADLAKALKLGPADISALIRIFKLADDEDVAVQVRKGKKRPLINYHPRAADEILRLIRTPPRGLSDNDKKAIERCRRKLKRTSGT